MFIRQRPYRHPSMPVVLPLIGAFCDVGKRRLLPGFDPCQGLMAVEKPPFYQAFVPVGTLRCMLRVGTSARFPNSPGRVVSSVGTDALAGFICPDRDDTTPRLGATARYKGCHFIDIFWEAKSEPYLFPRTAWAPCRRNILPG